MQQVILALANRYDDHAHLLAHAYILKPDLHHIMVLLQMGK